VEGRVTTELLAEGLGQQAPRHSVSIKLAMPSVLARDLLSALICHLTSQPSTFLSYLADGRAREAQLEAERQKAVTALTTELQSCEW
jgi:hypothetical protein